MKILLAAALTFLVRELPGRADIGFCNGTVGTYETPVARGDFGLVPDDRAPKVVDFIVKRGMACSPYFAQYYLEALCKNGRKDAARILMSSRGERSWLGMIDQGATMTMEAWSIAAKPNQDWNHAWGTAPLNIIARFFMDKASGEAPTIQ